MNHCNLYLQRNFTKIWYEAKRLVNTSKFVHVSFIGHIYYCINKVVDICFCFFLLIENRFT